LRAGCEGEEERKRYCSCLEGGSEGSSSSSGLSLSNCYISLSSFSFLPFSFSFHPSSIASHTKEKPRRVQPLRKNQRKDWKRERTKRRWE
jgi:hypothetical protein